jgi:hypothetical protein
VCVLTSKSLGMYQRREIFLVSATITELKQVLPAVVLLKEAVLPANQPGYHVLVPWQEFEQLPDAAFQPGVVATLTTPLLCVAAFTVVLL